MKKSPSELFETIETIKYSVTFNVVSGLNSFFRAMSQDETMLALAEIAADSEDNRQAIQDRIEMLLHNNPTPDNLSPYDVALAAYLLALEVSGYPLNDEQLGQLASDKALWWSKRLAGRYLSERHPAPLEPTR